MLIDQLEQQFNQLGLPPNRPRLVLAMPLVAVLTADHEITSAEARNVAEFARDTLDFDTSQMQFLHHWLASPPSQRTIEKALSLIYDLLRAKDVTTIETRTMSVVLMECERLLRAREVQRNLENPRGRPLLKEMSARLKIDLGEPWQDLAPEVFDENPETEPKKRTRTDPPVRRLRTAARLNENSSTETGGLV